MAAFINITLGAINLAGVNGFDGCSAMLQLLGFEDEIEQIVMAAVSRMIWKEQIQGNMG